MEHMETGTTPQTEQRAASSVENLQELRDNLDQMSLEDLAALRLVAESGLPTNANLGQGLASKRLPAPTGGILGPAPSYKRKRAAHPASKTPTLTLPTTPNSTVSNFNRTVCSLP